MKSELPKFIMIHIPRTGGGTLRRILENLYGNKFVFGEGRGSKYEDAYIIQGHFGHLQWTHLPRITFMRNPIERAISHYFWGWQHGKGRVRIGPARVREFKRQLTLEEFARATPNYITQFLGHNLDIFKFIGINEHYNTRLVLFSKVFGIDIDVNNYVYRNKAKSKKEISAEEKKKLSKYYTEDSKLYEKAKRMFHKKLEKYEVKYVD